MAKKVFFSFHYQDVVNFRANVVRTHWVTKPDRQEAGYYDASIWEEAKKQGDIALKRLINSGLEGTSNTCVLVGSQTYARPWVRYELLKSYVRGNHLLAVHINSINGKDQKTKPLGLNPLDFLGVTFSDDGRWGVLKEWDGNKWVDYEKIDGSARFSANVDATKRGRGFKLSGLFKIYDWKIDNGYENFANWLA